MYHVNARGIDERMINIHYYYYYIKLTVGKTKQNKKQIHTNLDTRVSIQIYITAVDFRSGIKHRLDEGHRALHDSTCLVRDRLRRGIGWDRNLSGRRQEEIRLYLPLQSHHSKQLKFSLSGTGRGKKVYKQQNRSSWTEIEPKLTRIWIESAVRSPVRNRN